MGQLRNALQPAITNINISWDDVSRKQQSSSKDHKQSKKKLLGLFKSKKIQGNVKESKQISSSFVTKQVPSKLRPIFDGTRLLAYYFYRPESNRPNKISIKADLPTGPLAIDIDVSEVNVLHEIGILRKLASRKKIQELEESKNIDEFGYGETDRTEDIKKTIIQIGLENGLTSQYTSFVGIDHSTGETINDQPMSTRKIKSQVATSWDSDSSCDSDSESDAGRRKFRTNVGMLRECSASLPPPPPTCMPGNLKLFNV